MSTPSRTRRSEGNWVVLLIIRMVGVASIVIVVVLYQASSRRRAAKSERLRLTTTFEEAVASARSSAGAFAFQAGTAALTDAENTVRASVQVHDYERQRLLEQLRVVRNEINGLENGFRQKLDSGWTLIGESLVSPEDQQKALAEERRRQEEARERALAEARAQDEAAARDHARSEERELAERQRRESEQSRARLGEAIRNLPPLHTLLDEKVYSNQQVAWQIWVVTMKTISLGGKPSEDPERFQVDRSTVIDRVRSADTTMSPLLLAYRDEMLDIVEWLNWPTYVVDHQSASANYVPITFARIQDKLVMIVGTIASETVFNSVNVAMNTPKKRAAAFVQRTVLPNLVKRPITERLRTAKLGYLGLVFVYGNRNFVQDGVLASESLCLVMSAQDFATFAQRKLSQEALLRNSSVFLAVGDPFKSVDEYKFIKVELTLE